MNRHSASVKDTALSQIVAPSVSNAQVVLVGDFIHCEWRYSPVNALPKLCIYW